MVNLLPDDATEEEVRAFIPAQLEDWPLEAEPGPFPYVVTRHFAGVYSSRPGIWDEHDVPMSPCAVIPCAAPLE